MTAKAPLIALIMLLAVSAWLAYASPPPPDKAAIEAESLRLQGVADSRNITRSDLSALEGMTASSPQLRNEVEEVGWMIDHGYQKHVTHSLNAVYWLAKDGVWLCPADSLSHVGLFLRYNESAMAAAAAAEGASTLAQWAAQARAVKQAHPEAYPDLEALISVMERVKPELDSADNAAAENDSAYLERNGYC